VQKTINEFDIKRIHHIRDLLEAVYNGMSCEFVEDKHLKVALSAIEKAITESQNMTQ
jgi:hypothetical protein